jgi:hypothetical protein
VNVTQRLRLTAVAVALTVPGLTSCGSNFNPPTDQVYNPGVGVNDRSGNVDVLHALIVSGEDGSGTVVAGLVNNDKENPDTLTGVSGAGDDGSIGVDAPPATEVPANGFLQLADEGEIAVTGTQIQPGGFIELTFNFERAESVTLEVPVVANTEEFADVPVPTGAASS